MHEPVFEQQVARTDLTYRVAAEGDRDRLQGRPVGDRVNGSWTENPSRSIPMCDSFLTGGTPVPQVVAASAVAASAMLDAEASAQFGTDLVVANDIGLHDEIAGFMRRLPHSATPARRRHTLVFENREGVA